MHTYEPCIRWVWKVKEVSVDYVETQVNNKIDSVALKFYKWEVRFGWRGGAKWNALDRI